MKRVLTVLSLLCVPLLAFSENKIKMVTYFPVPYVAYSKINASKQLDVGLTSACEMHLGCAESGALGKRPLQATEVNLNRGKLDLNTAAAVKSTNVTLGSGSGEANIDFAQNLRISTLNNGYSLESNDMNVSSLTLFRSHMSSDSAAKFPSCAATGASGAPQISWQKVKLKNAEEVYLLCGTPKESPEEEKDCSDYEYKVSHKSECCPSAPYSDSDCYYSYSSYKWESGGDGFSMAGTFGSDWIKQACEKNCWKGSYSTDCGRGGDLFEGAFTSPSVIVKGSQKYENHTCSQTVCDQGWYQSYPCNSSTKGMRFVHLYGYLGGSSGTTFVAYCPTKGSGVSPTWNGSMAVWTCKETQTTNKNGW